MHEVRSLMQNGGKHQLLAVKTTKASLPEGPARLNGVAISRSESRRSNQRREDRHLDLVDQAALYFRRRRHQVEVINVSNHGVMVRSDLQPNVGETLEIQFEDCNRTRCFARWIKDGRIGLELTDETVIIARADLRESIVSGRRAGEQPPKLEVKRERERRQSLLRTATLYYQQSYCEVRVHNISSQGMMIACELDLLPGTAVVIALLGAAANGLPGRVCWRRPGHMGIKFEQTFDLRILADAMAQSEPKPDAQYYSAPYR
jgi:hypothetical protein